VSLARKTHKTNWTLDSDLTARKIECRRPARKTLEFVYTAIGCSGWSLLCKCKWNEWKGSWYIQDSSSEFQILQILFYEMYITDAYMHIVQKTNVFSKCFFYGLQMTDTYARFFKEKKSKSFLCIADLRTHAIYMPNIFLWIANDRTHMLDSYSKSFLWIVDTRTHMP
jgi:hypothetical protein